MTETLMDAKNGDLTHEITFLTGEIVSAYVANNSVPVSDVPGLIGSVHAALTSLATGEGTAPPASVPIAQLSAAEIRRSVGRDGLVSFIDGKSYKTLKRHLTSHGLDPVSYRERYGLPTDYPMVAPSYAERRSALAKAIGLGRPGMVAETSRRERRNAA